MLTNNSMYIYIIGQYDKLFICTDLFTYVPYVVSRHLVMNELFEIKDNSNMSIRMACKTIKEIN